MKHPIIKLTLVFFILISMMGCSKFEKVYEWQQSKDENRILRYKYLGDNKFIFLDQSTKKGIRENNIIDNFSTCQFFNENNWTCEGALGKGKIVMQHGKIIWYYWGEVRRYEISPAETFAYTFLLD